MNPGDVIVEAGRLFAEGKPYALATVVNVVRPARRGDRALVTPDGRVTGWIGGACSEPTVVREALQALADREPRLARMEGGCASEGVVEVLIEPVVPAPLLAIVGTARLRARWPSCAHRRLAFATRASRKRTRSSSRPWATATRTSPQRPLRRGYVGPWRAPGVPPPSSRSCAPAASTRSPCCAFAPGRARPGPVLGRRSRSPSSPSWRWRHARGDAEPAPAEAVDPVCGMTGAALLDGADRPRGVTVFFCSAHCRARFEAEPDRYSRLTAP